MESRQVPRSRIGVSHLNILTARVASGLKAAG